MRATDRASRVASAFLRVHAVASIRAETIGRFGRAPRGGTGHYQPFPNHRRCGLRVESFEACSAFARATADPLAEPPDGGPSAPKCFIPLRFFHEPLRALPAGTNYSPGRPPPVGCGALARASDHVGCGTRQVAKIRACTYNRDIVLSRHEADGTSLASLGHMFFKQRAASGSTASNTVQVKPDRVKTPRVHARPNGVLYLDEEDLRDSEDGENALHEAAALEERLRKERKQR